MIGFLLKRPVAVIMSTIAFLVLGAVAMFQLPVSLMLTEVTLKTSFGNFS